MTDSTLVGLACLRCGSAASSAVSEGCAHCAQLDQPAAVRTIYDLDRASASFRSDILLRRKWGMSRYAELLPPGIESVTLSSGATPLIPLRRLGRHLGVDRLWAKDESQNPTWSFKDRPAAVAAARALLERKRGLVVSSTGNAAGATAAHAASVGLPAVILVAESVDPLMAGYLRAYGAHTIATRTKQERWVLMHIAVERGEFYPNSNYSDPPVGNDPYAIDGYKCVGFEVWEQLGCQSPAVIAMPVGYGDGLFGIYKAFQELSQMVGATIPRFLGGEIYGSLAHALEQDADHVEKVDTIESTLASSIATSQSTFQALFAMRSTDGLVREISDKEIMEAQELLVQMEGIFVEAASAAGLAALLRALEAGDVDRRDPIVVINTSAGIKSLAAMDLVGTTFQIVEEVEEFIAFLKEIPPNPTSRSTL